MSIKGTTPHEFQINLLRQKDLNLTEKLVYFALHYLRYIIVITQISVITVFFYRFKIDQDIIDLKEKVTQKQEIMKITTPLVNQAVVLEGKLNHIHTILNTQNQFSDPLDYVLAKVPESVSLDEVDMSDKSIVLKAHTLQIGLVKSIYQNYLSSKKFKNVTITGIGRDSETNIYQFSLTMELL